MRGGLSAIQQTLTPEAATVLTHSIAEAARRSHGQTTPLHVAATLLSSPSGLLRQACIKSHPNSSHPLQCRALELCFSVALDRLPTTASTTSPPTEPPLSNALIAALKRAQAHQRRGCPEQQQQPLLAVKVELEQLTISILDDPSVSRVMKEASFSSPAVKAAIEQAISSQPSTSPAARIGLGFRTPVAVGMGVGGRSLYLNPRLQQPQGGNNVNAMQSGVQGQGHGREEDVKKVMEILGKPSKRNPILVGESDTQEVVKEVLRRVEKIRDGVLKGLQVLCVERDFGGAGKVLGMIKELGSLIDRKMLLSTSGVIVDLGDLKWLVDQPAANLVVSDLAREAVMEMGKILKKFSEGRRVWFIGTATCDTYLRCQVYHPTMETEWDLQVVSIVAKPTPPGMLPRLGSNGGIISSSIECLTPIKSFQMAAPPLTARRVSENLDPLRRYSCCPHCTEKCNEELAKLTVRQPDKSSTEVKSDATSRSLPFWLQNARLSNIDSAKGATDSAQSKDQDLILRRQKEDLQKKWSDTCLQLHPNLHRGVSSERIIASPLSMTGLYMNPNLLARPSSQPKLPEPKSLGDALQLNISSPLAHQNSTSKPSPPGSPVRTDLMLGLAKSTEKAQDKAEKHGVKDLVGGISSELHSHKLPEVQGSDRPVTLADADSFKKLLKGLMEKVYWQKEAASAVASAIAQCKSSGKLRAGGTKGDIWLLFSGPDRIGKKKMAAALSEVICGMALILIPLGSRRDGDESDSNFRGKTVIDRICEAVRRNPFSVIMLQDIDEADMLIRGNIKRAMERGRLVDSHGREISLGNIIFIVTTNWVPAQQKGLSGGGVMLNEEKLISLASGGWQLRISIGEKPTGKRPPSWLHDDDDQGRAPKQSKGIGPVPGLSFDLNQLADTDDDRLDGSHNSSDLTVDHEADHAHQNRVRLAPASSAVHELLSCIDEAIIFNPVDFTPVRQNIERTIAMKFSAILGNKLSFNIETEALEKIMSGVWLGQTALESWADKVLVPSFHQIRTTLSTLPPRGSPEGKAVVRLELDNESGSRDDGDWLPGRVSVVANGW